MHVAEDSECGLLPRAAVGAPTSRLWIIIQTLPILCLHLLMNAYD